MEIENSSELKTVILDTAEKQRTFKSGHKYYLDKFGYQAYAYRKKGNIFYKDYSNKELNLYYLTANHVKNIKIN